MYVDGRHLQSEVSLDGKKLLLGGFKISIDNHHLFWMILETEVLGPFQLCSCVWSIQNESFPNNFPKCKHQHFLVLPHLNHNHEFGNNCSPSQCQSPQNTLLTVVFPVYSNPMFSYLLPLSFPTLPHTPYSRHTPAYSFQLFNKFLIFSPRQATQMQRASFSSSLNVLLPAPV